MWASRVEPLTDAAIADRQAQELGEDSAGNISAVDIGLCSDGVPDSSPSSAAQQLSSRAALQQGSKAVQQQGSRAAVQQCSRAAELQSSRAVEQQSCSAAPQQ
jgi:hypothetical protein